MPQVWKGWTPLGLGRNELSASSFRQVARRAYFTNGTSWTVPSIRPGDLTAPAFGPFGWHPGVYGRGCQLREWNTERHGSGRAVLTCAEAAGFPRCAARDVLQPVLPGTGSPRLSGPLRAWGFLGRNHATALLTAGRLFGAARVALNGRFSFPCEICRPAVKGGSLFIFFVKAL